ncbi:MAG: F0F1 ATP synthase subunit alpha [Pseudomonadales bacterium]|nr:F0F1 ATP synthase subunit alpha [Pseudomonadales bacterium]
MTDDLIKSRDRSLANYRFEPRIAETGKVVSVGDGIAWISGLPSAAIDDVLILADGSEAIVFDLNASGVGAILLKQTDELTSGVTTRATRRALGVPVGEGLLGRVVDPLGVPLDGKGDLDDIAGTRPLEGPSPTISRRDFVRRPLYTGSKIVDTMIPIGRGQRQLIIGDEGLGRSSLAIDTVLNQKDQDVLCIYVLIGQRRSSVVNTLAVLDKHGAMAYTTVVVAEASAMPGLKHLAPYAGCAIGEAWMESGRDVLVVYDDLSSHAATYRELSLLLRRPPGREAYPGDIFSIHARLLERSTCLGAGSGGGTMTALPIIETREGEIADYIPTNLISITDGQIYLDRSLFTSGFRPAIDIGKSVSRIGGQAQHPMIKAESGRMKLDYLQFQELEMFTRFGAKLEAAMQKSIRRGHVLREILKQDRYSPVTARFQLAWMIAFNEGLLDDVQIPSIPGLLSTLADHVALSAPGLDEDREKWVDYVTGFIDTSAS